MPEKIKHEYIRTNGITLHTVCAGPADGPLVILLHGFPEFWFGWRKQIPALAAAGYRVLAPDQRGYNLSDKPVGLRAYASLQLANDVAGLIDAMGREKAFVVGHDWGGMSAWYSALYHPSRLQGLVILNAPHPRVMGRQLRHNPAQRRRSWYAAFFQAPALPEGLIRAGNWRAGVESMRRSSREGTFMPAELNEYRRAWARPKAMSSMLAWYRASARAQSPRPESQRIAPPTLVIWGKRDLFLGEEMAAESVAMCKAGTLHMIPEAGHWVQHEEPERVNRQLLHFLEMNDYIPAPCRNSNNIPPR